MSAWMFLGNDIYHWAEAPGGGDCLFGTMTTILIDSPVNENTGLLALLPHSSALGAPGPACRGRQRASRVEGLAETE
jgi:hypothetical protein